jgi:hypothetical protein
MRDESEHARLCFALAGRYLGAPVGPGPLPLADASLHVGFEPTLALAFREGCQGETVAALEAHVACDLAEDDEVRQVLGRIAADELRHAELAWDFVSWALSTHATATRALLAVEAERIERRLAAPLPGSTDPGVPSHGVLGDGQRAELHHVTLREVVAPRLATFLGERGPRSRAATSRPLVSTISTWPV